LKVVWSPLAIERAVEQAEFVARDKPEAARLWLIDLFAATGRLSRFPDSGRKVPETAREEVREIDFRGFRVVYHRSRKQVSILTVRNARRQLDRRELDPRSRR